MLTEAEFSWGRVTDSLASEGIKWRPVFPALLRRSLGGGREVNEDPPPSHGRTTQVHLRGARHPASWYWTGIQQPTLGVCFWWHRRFGHPDPRPLSDWGPSTRPATALRCWCQPRPHRPLAARQEDARPFLGALEPWVLQHSAAALEVVAPSRQCNCRRRSYDHRSFPPTRPWAMAPRPRQSGSPWARSTCTGHRGQNCDGWLCATDHEDSSAPCFECQPFGQPGLISTMYLLLFQATM